MNVALNVALNVTLMAADQTIYDFTLDSIDGEPTPLTNFKGKVALLVNVASRCAYTPQYSALESIYEKYQGQGFVVIGIPANNFAQEPGSNQEIKDFATRTYKVTFPMMAKVSVDGSDITPLYRFLTDKTLHPKTGWEIGWNFAKFLVGWDGKVAARFDSEVEPDSEPVIAAIEKALAKKIGVGGGP